MFVCFLNCQQNTVAYRQGFKDASWTAKNRTQTQYRKSVCYAKRTEEQNQGRGAPGEERRGCVLYLWPLQRGGRSPGPRPPIKPRSTGSESWCQASSIVYTDPPACIYIQQTSPLPVSHAACIPVFAMIAFPFLLFFFSSLSSCLTIPVSLFRSSHCLCTPQTVFIISVHLFLSFHWLSSSSRFCSACLLLDVLYAHRDSFISCFSFPF
jgi:hypothetical protein